jgi:hypothetical protein
MVAMTLFSGKILVFALGIILVLGFGMGYFHWRSDHYRCFQKRYFSEGSWHTLMTLGKLELRYRTINYDCDPEWKLDPAQYEKNDYNQIVPKQLTE